MKSLHIVFASAVFASTLALQPALAAPRDVSASTPVETRLDYLQKLLQSRSGQTLARQDTATIGNILDMLAKANQALAAGDNAKADKLSREAVAILMKGIRQLPDDPEITQQLRKRYTNLRQGLEKFSHAQSSNRQRLANETGQDKGRDYNHAKVAELIRLADGDAGKGDYERAISRLTEAQTMVTASLQGMLNNQTLVNTLDIDTPEKEYFYELRRYLGYEELIPVALEVKVPPPDVVSQMQQKGERAKWMAAQAREKAMAGDYPVAIRMVMDATDVVREALRQAGVDM